MNGHSYATKFEGEAQFAGPRLFRHKIQRISVQERCSAWTFEGAPKVLISFGIKDPWAQAFLIGDPGNPGDPGDPGDAGDP